MRGLLRHHLPCDIQGVLGADVFANGFCGDGYLKGEKIRSLQYEKIIFFNHVENKELSATNAVEYNAQNWKLYHILISSSWTESWTDDNCSAIIKEYKVLLHTN